MAKTKKLTALEGQALINTFVQSGLKATKFCAHNKIHYHVLQYWRKRFEPQSAVAHKKQANFSQLRLLGLKLNRPSTCLSSRSALNYPLMREPDANHPI